MDFLDKYMIFATGAPFPLTEEQQRRYDAPFVKADFEIRLGNGKRKVTGMKLGVYGVFQKSITYIPNGYRIGEVFDKAVFAKAVVRLLHVYEGETSLIWMPVHQRENLVKLVRLSEKFLMGEKQTALFDKQGRPHNQARYLWRLLPTTESGLMLEKKLYIGGYDMGEMYRQTYSGEQKEKLIQHLSAQGLTLSNDLWVGRFSVDD